MIQFYFWNKELTRSSKVIVKDEMQEEIIHWAVIC